MLSCSSQTHAAVFNLCLHVYLDVHLTTMGDQAKRTVECLDYFLIECAVLSRFNNKETDLDFFG